MYLGGVVEDAGFSLCDAGLFVSGVEHQLVKILSETSLVGIEGFLRSVLSSVIDGDADGSSELDAEPSSLDFSKGESSAESGSVAIPNGLASDGGSQFIERSGGDGGGFGSSGL